MYLILKGYSHISAGDRVLQLRGAWWWVGAEVGADLDTGRLCELAAGRGGLDRACTGGIHAPWSGWVITKSYITEIKQVKFMPHIGTRTNTVVYPLSPGMLFHDFFAWKTNKISIIINKFIVSYFVFSKV